MFAISALPVRSHCFGTCMFLRWYCLSSRCTEAAGMFSEHRAQLGDGNGVEFTTTGIVFKDVWFSWGDIYFKLVS